VIPNISQSYYSQLVWGIERQAESMGFQLILAHSLDRGDIELAEVRKAISRQVEGLFLIPAIRWQNRLLTLDLLKEARVPVVMLDRYPAGAERYPQTSWVVCRDERGVELAVQHLLELGHEEILFLAGPQGSSSSAARFSGYQRAMNASSVKYSDSRVFLAGQDIEGGRNAMAQALSEGVVMTAVIAFNDEVAIGAIEILLQQGFRVPEDVSVIGFGDGQLASYFRIGLTTLRIPQLDLGAGAVHLMEDILQGKKVDPREFPVELIVRHSTAKAMKSMA
jgi:DNA-binding LacI/PurR family transcriptional regulator